MYIPKPVAYCILDADMEKCHHIEYGVLDAPADAVMLYDQYTLERLQRALEASERANEYLRSQLDVAKQPEAPAQDTEDTPLQEYTTNVVVKFKDGHIEHHKVTNEAEYDNMTIIKQVIGEFPNGSVLNVLIVEQ